MNKNDLARLWASKADLEPAMAADQLDRVVADILGKLRRGNSVALPGLGVLQPGGESGIQLVPDRARASKEER